MRARTCGSDVGQERAGGAGVEGGEVGDAAVVRSAEEGDGTGGEGGGEAAGGRGGGVSWDEGGMGKERGGGKAHFVTVVVAVVNVKESISISSKVEVDVEVPWVMVWVVLDMMVEVVVV